jgi:hypothetical protein
VLTTAGPGSVAVQCSASDMRWSQGHSEPIHENAQTMENRKKEEKRKIKPNSAHQIGIISPGFVDTNFASPSSPLRRVGTIVEEFPGGGAELRHRAAGLGARGEPDPC